MPVWNFAKKEEYFARVDGLLGQYTKAFIVGVDNVGSKQMQEVRKALRGKATILMGKNTRLRKIIQTFVKNNPGHPIEALISQCRGNMGIVFLNGDLGEVKATLKEVVRPAPARVGAICPVDVIIPKGPTGCDPGQTSFFQVLQIGTKIAKGQIEITNDVTLLKEGDKVGNSEAALLKKLDISPFTYGLVIKAVYNDGNVFDAKVLDLDYETLVGKFSIALRNIAAVSLAIGIPTTASVPHSIANAFKTILAVAINCETYSFEKAELYKAYLADPSAFASAGGGDSSAPAEEATKKEEVVEEDVDVGAGGMFGSDY